MPLALPALSTACTRNAYERPGVPKNGKSPAASAPARYFAGMRSSHRTQPPPFSETSTLKYATPEPVSSSPPTRGEGRRTIATPRAARSSRCSAVSCRVASGAIRSRTGTSPRSRCRRRRRRHRPGCTRRACSRVRRGVVERLVQRVDAATPPDVLAGAVPVGDRGRRLGCEVRRVHEVLGRAHLERPVARESDNVALYASGPRPADARVPFSRLKNCDSAAAALPVYALAGAAGSAVNTSPSAMNNEPSRGSTRPRRRRGARRGAGRSVHRVGRWARRRALPRVHGQVADPRVAVSEQSNCRHRVRLA